MKRLINIDHSLLKNTILLFSGILLPLWDVLSDLIFSITLLYFGHIIMGISSLCPVIVTNALYVPHWWKLENTWEKKLSTAVLILFGFWPQYRVARLLYLGWKKDPDYIMEKNFYQESISGIGIFTRLFLL